MSVVSKDSVRLDMMLSSLNYCDNVCSNVQNTYMNVMPKENVYFETGEEFVRRRGQNLFIFRALSGLKVAGAA